MPNAKIQLNIYDGRRRLLEDNVQCTATAIDGRGLSERKTLIFPAFRGGSQLLSVPFFDNFGDNYTVVVDADGFDSGAWRPISASDRAPVVADLMVLPKNGTPHFAEATWDKLRSLRPNVARVIRACCPSADAAGAMYSAAFEARAPQIACFLNLVTAMADIQLPSGKNPLDYYWNAGWPGGDPESDAWRASFDNIMKVDRFFGYVDQALVADLRGAAQLGAFSKEPDPEKWGHAGATESYKQTQFDVANVQLTIHGRDTATLRDSDNNMVQCVKIEPDIDYFRDPVAHGLLEYLPNTLTRGKTDSKVVYMLRWMAARREAHLPEFNPLYTIES